MFEFLLHTDDYDQRKVARYENERLMVSTARVYDADKPYETAVEHTDFNSGKIVIVETYDTKEEAEQGHAKWVAIMTDCEHLPDALHDVSGAGVAQLLDAFGSDDWRLKKRGESEQDT